jgi:DNA-directed RNA polymerase specialized sigma24 family protein
VSERTLNPVLPEGVDNEGYTRIRGLMRLCVLRVWGSDRVIAGMDPWVIVDEAWASMTERGFRSEGPFLPFALRVARNKALDARNRAEARRRDRSLDEPIATGDTEPLALAEVTAGSPGADADYFSKIEHVEVLQQLAVAEEAIYRVLSQTERTVFLAVRVAGRSRAAVGRELDPPVTGQRVGQIVAAATMKIKAHVEQSGV